MELQPFDPASIKNNSTVLIDGVRGTGKTELVHDIVYNLRDRFRFGVQMGSKGEHGYVPEFCSFDSVNPRILEKIMKYQKKHNENILCVLDGFTYEDVKPNVNFLMNGRHRNVSSILTNQGGISLPPLMRGQIDYLFVTGDHREKEKLWKHYFAGMFPEFEDFTKVFDECTNEDYKWLVLDLSNRTSRIYSYKAEPKRSFRMGGDDIMWALCDK